MPLHIDELDARPATDLSTAEAVPVGAHGRPRRVVVVGAGISGLAAAHHLQSVAPAVEVVVLERSDRVGGMVQTEIVDGRVIELGPEGFVSNRPEALDLVDAVGLADELIVDGPAARQTFIARGERLLPLPYGVMNPDRTAAADLLRSPLLGVRGRLRLMAEPLIPRRRPNRDSLPGTSRWSKRLRAATPEADQPITRADERPPVDEHSANRTGAAGNADADGSADGAGSVDNEGAAGSAWSGGTDVHDDESVAAFVRRRFGDEMLTALVDPLIGGIHGSSTDELSADMLVPALRRIELDGGSVALTALRRSRRSGRRPIPAAESAPRRPLPPLVSLRRGMGSLTDAVAHQLKGSIRLGIGVTSIEPTAALPAPPTPRSVAAGEGSSPRRWRVRCDNGSVLDADAVIVATPPGVTAELLTPLAAATAAEIGAMPWGSSTTVSLTWAPGQVTLDMGTGYLVPAGEGGVVAACTFTTAKWHHRSADGSTMVRCFMRGDDVGSMSDDELVAAARDELRRRVGVTALPADASVRRVPVALPVMKVGHRARVRAIHGGLDGLTGLALAGGGLEGAGLPACIRSGRLAADRVLAVLSS